MGGRTNPRLAQSKPSPGQGFRSFDRQRQSLGLHRLRAAAHQEISLTVQQPIRLRFGHSAMQAKESGALGRLELEPGDTWCRTPGKMGTKQNFLAGRSSAVDVVGLT